MKSTTRRSIIDLLKHIKKLEKELGYGVQTDLPFFRNGKLISIKSAIGAIALRENLDPEQYKYCLDGADLEEENRKLEVARKFHMEHIDDLISENEQLKKENEELKTNNRELRGSLGILHEEPMKTRKPKSGKWNPQEVWDGKNEPQ